MYEEDDVITFGKLCEILIADPLYSQDDLTKEIVSPEWSKIKRPRILGFYNDYSPQRKLAILISKKNTLNIPQKYIAFAWVSYYDPNCLEAENEEKSIFRSALDSKEIKVVAVESFFKKYCIPHPATFFPQYSTNSKTVYDALIGSIPAGVKRRMSLTRIQKATSELQKNIDPVAVVQEAAVVEAATTRTSSNKKLEADQEECREIARLIWSNDPEKRIDTVAQEIALGTHVVGQPCKWRDGHKSASAVRKWIKIFCPAPRPGRPRKNP